MKEILRVVSLVLFVINLVMYLATDEVKWLAWAILLRINLLNA